MLLSVAGRLEAKCLDLEAVPGLDVDVRDREVRHLRSLARHLQSIGKDQQNVGRQLQQLGIDLGISPHEADMLGGMVLPSGVPMSSPGGRLRRGDGEEYLREQPLPPTPWPPGRMPINPHKFP